MDIRDLITKEYIIDDLKSKTKREVLVELAEVFKRGNIAADTIPWSRSFWKEKNSAARE